MKITFGIDITDAHMHLPTAPAALSGKKDALYEEMRKNGISRGIVISDSELESSIGTLSDCAELFKDCADIAVVGGISPYIQYEKQLKLLESYIAEGAVAGIKLFCGHEPIYINDPVLQPVFGLAEKYSVPLLFHSGWDNAQYASPERIRAAAKKYPQIKFICCHCCYPTLASCFETLLQLPNIFFDISSIADSDTSTFKAVLEQSIHQKPEHFIFGSDFGSCSQAAHLAFAQSLCIADRERRPLMHDNADRLYFR